MKEELTAIARPRAVRWTLRPLTVVIAVSLVGGIVAAMLGGSLDELGSGAGGLYGVPSILTTLIALFVAIPAAVVVARQAHRSPGWLRAGIVVAAGAWVVAVGYFVVAHAIDPCVNGWWDAGSRIGDQPLCRRYGPELNWHPRFHLLAHAGPAAILLAGYIWAVHRWADPPQRASPARRELARRGTHPAHAFVDV
jgi:hypothetical protein